MVGAQVRDVEPLDPHRQRLQVQRFPQGGQRVHPLLAAPLGPQLVLGEREPGVALGQLAQPPLVAALGNAHLDRAAAAARQSLREQLGARPQRRAHDHQPRHRRHRRVVLGGELLGHLVLAALPLVGEVEAMALGEHAVADLEHLCVGGGPVGGDRDQVGRLQRLPGDAAALHQRADRLEAVAVDRRPLELLAGGGLGHLALQVALDVAIAAGEEVDDRLDVAPVLLAVDVADARRLAALDVVVEARNPRSPPRLRALAGPVLEQLAEQVERLAHPARARERPEVDAAGAVALAGEVDARKLLVQAHPHVRDRTCRRAGGC